MRKYQTSYPGNVYEVKIGRKNPVTIGGEKALPFYFSDGPLPNKALIAMEVLDKKPQIKVLETVLGDVWHSPALWAKRCVELGAQAVCLNLISAKPDEGDSDAAQVCETVESVLTHIDVPLIIKGTGNAEKDNLILPAICQAAKGENLLIGPALQENYKILSESAVLCGHKIIAESPIDINIAKQLNIMLNDGGCTLENIVMDPTTGALGYGLEYSFSIMERARLAALSGDRFLASPFINFVGKEVWHVKESYAENPAWGDAKKRGVMWEALTALAFIQAGSNIVVMRHPEAVKLLKKTLSELIP